VAFAIGTDTGTSFIASVVSNELYDPVTDTDVDASFVWQVINSWYRQFMEDPEIFETFWESVLQYAGAELLDLWQGDYAKSLRDIPVISQRKWVKYSLLEQVDFLLDPELSVLGEENKFVYDPDLDLLACTWKSRGGLDRAYLDLRGEATEEASLRWSFRVTLSSIEAKASTIWGYFNSQETLLKNALVVGLLGDTSANKYAGMPRLFLAHYAPDGAAAVSVGSVILSMDTEYRVDATYTARTGALVATLTETEYERVSSSTGQTGESAANDAYTSEFSDLSIDFDAAGVVVGDTLVYNGTSFEILSVLGSVLVVTPATLPAEATSLTYQILGEEELFSLSMDLPGDALDPSFTVDQFGTANMDIRSVPATLYTPAGEANQKKCVGTTSDWEYTDPTLAETALSIPRLQDQVTNPTLVLYEGTDYLLVSSLETGTELWFQEPPPDSLWAEYSGYDEGQIYQNFGANVGLLEKSSDSYKAKVRGLYYAYFQGPRIVAMEIGIHILLGLPIADRAGTVESINPNYSGTVGQITVAGLDYLYPLSVGTSLNVGDQVSLFEPLSDGVEIKDYLSDPLWWEGLSGFNELQKYHSFGVLLNADAFDIESLQLAGSFVNTVKRTNKEPYFIVFKSVQDQFGPVDLFDLDDVLSFVLVLNLWDVPCDAVIVRYDSMDFEGTEADWKYSQGVTDWDETSAAMRSTSVELLGTASITASSTAASGTGTSWLSQIGGPGAVADKYVSLARYVAGTAGETAAGLNTFVDQTAGAFDDLEVGGTIDIDGEGVFEIQSVDTSNQITVDGSMSGTATGVSWAATGLQNVWAEVGSVTDDNDLDFSTAVPSGLTGDYVLYLLDTAYKDVFYDQFLEGCPDERLVFEGQIAVGYQETLLTGTLSFTDSSTAVTGIGTDFVNEIGGPGAVTDKFISTSDGAWLQVASVTDATNLVLNATCHDDFPDVSSFLASAIMAGTFTFTNGSATVTASSSQTGVVAAGDWIQVVPVQDTADPVGSTPVVQVQSIDGPGTTITLSSTYSGDDASGVKANHRGTSSVLPLAQNLPVSQTGVSSYNFTGWYGQGIGDTISSTVAEPTP